jgi:hypothetical protein
MPRRRMRKPAVFLLLLVGALLLAYASASKDHNDFYFLDTPNYRRRAQDGTLAPTELFQTAKKDKKGEPTRLPTRTPTSNGKSLVDGEGSAEGDDDNTDVHVHDIVLGLGATSAAVMLAVAAKQRKKRTLPGARPGGARGHHGSNGRPRGKKSQRSAMSSVGSSVATGESRQMSGPTRSSRIDMLRRGTAKAGQAANKSFGDLQTRSKLRKGATRGGGGGGGTMKSHTEAQGFSERQALESLTEWEGSLFAKDGPARLANGGKREPRGARHKDGVNAFWQYASAGIASAGQSPKSRGSSNYMWRSPAGASNAQSKGYVESTNSDKTWGTPSAGGGVAYAARPELPQHMQGLAALLVVAARLRRDFEGQQEASDIFAAEQRVNSHTTASQFLKELYRICGQQTVGSAVEYARNRTSFRGAMMRARERVVGIAGSGAQGSFEDML